MPESIIGPISRIMIFSKNAKSLGEFYRDKIGLTARGEFSEGWAELNAGSCDIAIHGGESKTAEEKGSRSLKIIFACSNVEQGKRELESRGVRMGDVHSFKHETKDVSIQICDGADPEGNLFQLSSRNLN